MTQSENDKKNPVNHIVTPVVLIVCVLALGAVSYFSSGQIGRTVSEALIMLVMVVGLFSYVGNSGVFSFGHSAFVMIGAYAQAWQTCCPRLKPITMSGLPDFLLENTIPDWGALLASGVFAAMCASIVGVILIRLSGLAAAIATFAFLSVISIVYSNLDRVTGGTSSLIGIPASLNVFEISVVTALVLAIAYGFKVSRYGLMLRASRDDYFAAKASGIRLYQLRFVAFILSCFLSGIAGAMFAHFLGVLSVDGFYLQMTMMVIAMMVIGGARSITGCVVGVAFVTILNLVLRSVENGVEIAGVAITIPTGSQQVAVGLILLLILIFRPKGLTGGKELDEIINRSKT